MDLKRFYHSIILYNMWHSKQRGDYIRKHNLFHHCGENVRICRMLLPLYPKLISIGNNVEIASGVSFAVHDAIHGVLNGTKYYNVHFEECMGCIEIGDNVFIGEQSIILHNVKIGSDVIIGANTLVNRDIPSGGVYAGIPAKRIGSFYELMEKRKQQTKKDIYTLWSEFEQLHNKV